MRPTCARSSVRAPQLSYAADWSEYFGHHPQDGSADVFFHLDPLWSDDEIDFVGIDNYMPLSDWRDGLDHVDVASADAITDLDYLRGNVEGPTPAPELEHGRPLSKVGVLEAKVPIGRELSDQLGPGHPAEITLLGGASAAFSAASSPL